MLQRTVTALVTSALLGAVLLIAPAPSAAASGTFIASTITGGDDHTCALTFAGAAYCWGNNDYGQLGDGTDTNRLTPTAVRGGLKFTSISASNDHTCALTSAGVAYCWGENDDGQVGDGTDTNRLTPTAVSGGLKFTSIDAGDSDTCALTSAGAAYCWGYDQGGSLGTGVAENANTPQAVIGGHTFISISAGDDHTCGLTTAGAAYCWGYNDNGELGNGNTSSSEGAGPRAVIGNLKFASVMANGHNSGNHSCGITTAGDAYCWGYNGYGALGDGTTDSSDSAGPQLVVGGIKWLQEGSGGCDRSSRARERCRPTR